MMQNTSETILNIITLYTKYYNTIYVCIYICIYIYIHTCLYIDTYIVYMYVYMYMQVYTHTHTYICMLFSSPGDLHNPSIEHTSLATPTLAGEFFTTCATWEAIYIYIYIYIERERERESKPINIDYSEGVGGQGRCGWVKVNCWTALMWQCRKM